MKLWFVNLPANALISLTGKQHRCFESIFMKKHALDPHTLYNSCWWPGETRDHIFARISVPESEINKCCCMCTFDISNVNFTIYIYIYIYREREREREIDTYIWQSISSYDDSDLWWYSTLNWTELCWTIYYQCRGVSSYLTEGGIHDDFIKWKHFPR